MRLDWRKMESYLSYCQDEVHREGRSKCVVVWRTGLKPRFRLLELGREILDADNCVLWVPLPPYFATLKAISL